MTTFISRPGSEVSFRQLIDIKLSDKVKCCLKPGNTHGRCVSLLFLSTINLRIGIRLLKIQRSMKETFDHYRRFDVIESTTT